MVSAIEAVAEVSVIAAALVTEVVLVIVAASVTEAIAEA